MSDKIVMASNSFKAAELRDKFAMAALTGILANPEDSHLKPDFIVPYCYEMADLMMAERTNRSEVTQGDNEQA